MAAILYPPLFVFSPFVNTPTSHTHVRIRWVCAGVCVCDVCERGADARDWSREKIEYGGT